MLDIISKRIVAVAILFFSLTAFVFSLSTITKANALPSEMKENTLIQSSNVINPLGISGGKAYFIYRDENGRASYHFKVLDKFTEW